VGTRRHYTRFTPFELERARRDAGWAQSYLFEVWKTWLPDNGPVARRRMLDLDKSWIEIDLVLSLGGIPVTTHIGTHRLYPDDDEVADEHGRIYEGATYLTPDEVATAARVLEPLSLVTVCASIDPAVGDAAMAEHYADWSCAQDACAVYDRAIGEFFAAAAAAGDAMVADTS
jgi:hypothetical protein